MTRLIIDDATSQTPIGELLASGSDDVIELRSQAGELLGTLLIADRHSERGADEEQGADEERGADEREQQLASYRDAIQERMSRPPAQGLTTSEFLKRLGKLGTDA